MNGSTMLRMFIRCNEQGHKMRNVRQFDSQDVKARLTDGVYGKCDKCGALVRWYFDRFGGEAYMTTCSVRT